jgi:hypothetical protein
MIDTGGVNTGRCTDERIHGIREGRMVHTGKSRQNGHGQQGYNSHYAVFTIQKYQTAVLREYTILYFWCTIRPCYSDALSYPAATKAVSQKKRGILEMFGKNHYLCGPIGGHRQPTNKHKQQLL